MKRKKNMLELLVPMLLICMGARGQTDNTFRPIADQCVWSVSNMKFMTCGDTIISGTTYLKLYRQESSQPFDFNVTQAEYLCAIRNDVENKRTYMLVPAGKNIYNHPYGSPIFTTESDTELLLYDFSLALGDTVTYYQFEEGGHAIMQLKGTRVSDCTIGVGYTGYQHISVDFNDNDSLVTLEDGSETKRILIEHYCDAFQPHATVWIEGIGNLEGFAVNSQHLSVDGSAVRLLCVEQENAILYKTGFDMGDNDPDDCFCSGFGGGVAENQEVSAIVYPNPATEQVLISTESSSKRIENVILCDIQGKVIYNQTIGDYSGEVNLTSIPAGIYLLKAVLEDGTSFVKKIVKE